MEIEDEETSAFLKIWKTELWLSVRASRSAALDGWLTSLLNDEVASLDLLASRFRPDSQLSTINRNAGHWTEVSWDFVSVLTASVTAAQASGGLVDPLLGRHLVAAGYDRWANQDSRVSPDWGASRWQDIEVAPGRSAAKVRIPHDSALDLGAVAKGWLADRLAQIAHTSTGLDALANMGGDLRVISPRRPWVVAADADVPGVPETAMEVTDAGLATSGIGHRAWAQGHHIIDPRTGKPAATCWSSVSVLAADAAGANTAATAGLILGDPGPDWLAALGLDGWFLGWDGQRPDSLREAVVGAWPQVQRRGLTPA